MPILVDTNILLRTQDVQTSGHADAVAFMLQVHDRVRHPFVACAQVLIEFWSVATRPADVNGLGMTAERAAAKLDDLVRVLPCLPEPPDVAERWRALLRETTVEGKQAHDARLVAFMRAHAITRVITLNPRHLARFAGVTCVSPAEALAANLIDETP